MIDKLYRPLMIALLTVLVIVQIVGLVANFQRNAKLDVVATKRDANCKIASDLVVPELATLNTSYQNDVYSNSSTDTIYKQILLANEYQFNTELLIATLNTACQ